ncbi:MAG TPA: immunoglobulin domain-containing protein [Candidatus Baltobacteraceae bacterium]|jgi:hypothetical protein|nr:immunoglobulin domain-containing protein [Candidatus Baltobacteraceae bacterium]
MDLKRLIGGRCAWPLAAALLLFLCRNACAQTPVSDYGSLVEALETSTVITDFATNSVITLSTVGQTLEITTNVLIDGTTNDIVFDGSSLTRLFHVHPKCQLILNNLQLLNGISSSGGAIFNEGTLIISNCLIGGNGATNVTGVNGTTNTSGGNGSDASSGGSATGGAIFSTGPLFVYFSVLGTNSASGGTGGTGGSGGGSAFFGGNGGNGGSGGSAAGAAIYSSGSNNVFFADEFIDNVCIAGAGGSGGTAGGGSFDAGDTGQGGTGGSATGGALCIIGNLAMSNCLFYLNSATAGASAPAQILFDGSGSDGNAGGSAVGGGLYVAPTAGRCDVVNTVFFNNSCTGGAGGSAPGNSATGGNGGLALGGGLNSAAVHAFVISCTLATNTLAGGASGTGGGGSGTTGTNGGWDICVTGGGLRMSDSILSGGTNQAPDNTPNALGVTDGGYNVCSDASLVKSTSTTLLNANTGLDSGLAADGGPSLGPADVVTPAMLTLALLGGPATQFIPGVAGITFPATDELLQARGSPASAGAFEFAPITIATNAPLPTITTQPVGETNDIGTAATFTVSAAQIITNTSTTTITNGTNAITTTTTTLTTNSVGYQWQLNGTNLIDNATFLGATTSNLTVKRVSLADQGPYQVIVGLSTLEGVTTSAVAYLVAIVPPKITVQPARKLDEPDGAIVSFTVTATGAEPMYYQWRNGTQNLSDGNGISGSLTSNLVISPATFSDAGTYSVLIANAYGTATSIPAPLTIVADKTHPTVAITSPGPNARTTNSVISGKASDNAQVTEVFWVITNINAGGITVTSNYANLDTNGTTTRTWSISNAVAPGTNIVSMQSVDFSGNLSAVVTEKFFEVAPALFALAISGPGTVKGSASIAGNIPPTNGAMLNIGEGYTLAASPSQNYVFTNWTSDGIPTFSPTLHFIMEPGLEVTAYFTPNLFGGAAGTYNGLFYDEVNGVTEQTAGMLSQLTVNSKGAYSGKLLLDGASYSLGGSFDVSGGASNYIVRSASRGGPVTVEMTLQWTTGQINGAVSGSGPDAWTSALFAEAAATASSSGEYTLLLLPTNNAASEIPPGDGYLLLTNHLGHMTVSGALADGTDVNQATSLGRMGDVPLFANLYSDTGLLLGWVGFTNGTIQAETPLTWIRPSARPGLFADGFTNRLSLVAAGWTNPPTHVSSVVLPSGTLVISSADLDVTNLVSVATNTVVKDPGSPPNSLTGTINPKTGLMTIIFGNGTGKATITGYGAVLQDTVEAGGYFVTKTNAGAISLAPN